MSAGGPEYDTRIEVRRRLVQRDAVVDAARAFASARQRVVDAELAHRSIFEGNVSFYVERMERAADRLQDAVGELDK